MPLVGTCPICGNKFQHSASQRKTYCSKQCAYASPERSAKLRDHFKAQWNDPILRQRLLDGIEKRSQSEEWQSAPHFQQGEKHPRYKGEQRARLTEVRRYEYKRWHKAVLQKDNYTCQQCGKRGGRFQVHHIQSWAEHPDLRYEVTNGLTLCEDCHIAVHGNKRKPVTTQCAYCGQDFRPAKSTSKFCSMSCSGKASAQKRKRQPKPCEICGSVFTPGKAKARFCSTPCAMTGRRRPASWKPASGQ